MAQDDFWPPPLHFHQRIRTSKHQRHLLSAPKRETGNFLYQIMPSASATRRNDLLEMNELDSIWFPRWHLQWLVGERERNNHKRFLLLHERALFIIRTGATIWCLEVAACSFMFYVTFELPSVTKCFGYRHVGFVNLAVAEKLLSSIYKFLGEYYCQTQDQILVGPRIRKGGGGSWHVFVCKS